MCAAGRGLRGAGRGVSARLPGAEEKRTEMVPGGREGSGAGGTPPPPPLPWLRRGGVAAGAAGERLCAGGVRLPGLRFRARWGGEGAAPLWPEGAVRGAAEGRGRLRWGRSAGLAASCPRPSQPLSAGSGPCLYKESESGSERQGNESAVLPGETGRAGCAGGGAARVGGGAVGATALGAGSWALLLFRLAVASSAFDLFECSGRPGGVTRGCVWGGVLCLGRAGVQRGGSSPWGRLRDQRRRRGVPSRRAICEWRGRDSPRSGTAFYVTD